MSPVPDIQSGPANDGQSVPDSTDWASVSAGLNATGILSGCVVSAYGTPGMGAQITAGSVAISGTQYVVSAASVSFQPASPSDRRDIVIVTLQGGGPGVQVSVLEGNPCGTANWTRNTYPGLPPVKPALAANAVFLADIYVPAAATSITNADIETNTTTLHVGTFTSSGVSSFNTRSGNVVLSAADVESTFSAAGQLLVGTGSGTGELLSAGSVTTVLTSNGATSVPSWQPATGGGSGSVTAAAIEATFTAKGQLYVGTGFGTGELLAVGSVGTVLYSNGSASIPSWNAASVGGNMNTTVYDPAGVSQQLLGTSATQTVTNKRINLRVLAQSAPGATPAINTDNYDVVNYTGIATAITNLSTNLSGTPVDGQTLRISFTDNGSARAITWGTGFENSIYTSLPTTTIISARLDVGFFWNTATSKWRCVAQS